MHREELKNSDFKQTQLASLQVELGKANSNKASFRQIDLNLRTTLPMRRGLIVARNQVPYKDDTLPCKCQALAWKNEPKAWIQGFQALKFFLVA